MALYCLQIGLRVGSGLSNRILNFSLNTQALPRLFNLLAKHHQCEFATSTHIGFPALLSYRLKPNLGENGLEIDMHQMYRTGKATRANQGNNEKASRKCFGLM